MAFTPTEAALEGFRLTREKPVPVLVWSAAYLVVSFLASLALVLVMGPDMSAISSFAPGAQATPEEVLAMVPVMGKLYAVSLPLGIVSLAVFNCAILRAILRPQDSRFAYLRFGGDELRMILLYVLLVLILFGVMIGATVAAMILAVLVSLVTGPTVGAAIGTLLSLLVLVGSIAFVGVRLSLSAPVTFAGGRIDLRESWRLSDGRFWTLLGVYILAWVLGTLVALLGFVIMLAVGVAIGGSLTEITQPDFSTLATYFTPTRVVQLIFGAVLSTLQYVILLAPPALIFASLHRREAAPTAETFA